MSPQLRSQLLLLLPAFILAIILAGQLTWGNYEPSDIDKASGQRVNIPVAQQFRMPPIDQAYTHILDRPINLPNRRQPPLPGVKKSAPTSAPIVNFKLVGIVMTEGNNIALIRETASGKMRSLKAGVTINGMNLEKVESDRIIFRKGATVHELMLTIETR